MALGSSPAEPWRGDRTGSAWPRDSERTEGCTSPRDGNPDGPSSPSHRPSHSDPTFGPEQGGIAGVVAVGLAIMLWGERKSISPDCPRQLFSSISAHPMTPAAPSRGGQGPPGQQTSPLHGLQTSGSCYTSHISSRAGASPSPEKSPSQLPQKGGVLVDALNGHKKSVLAGWPPCHQP